MRKHPSTLFLCFVLFSAIAYFSCRKTIDISDSDQNFPIELKSTQVGDSILLEWDNKRTTSFTKTIVLRSNEPIPPGATPFETGQQVVAFSTTDNSTSSVKLSLPIFSSKAFFKVYVQLGARFVESNAVEASFSRFVGDGRPENTFFHPDSSWMVMAVINGQGSSSFVTLDYRTQKKMGEYSLGFSTDFNTISCSFTQKQGKAYMIASSNNQYFKFEMPAMNLVGSGNLNYSTWDVLAGTANDFVYMTQYDYIQGMSIRKWGTPETTLKTFERPNDYYYPRKLAFLDESSLKFVEVSAYSISRYQASPTTGNLVSAYTRTTTSDGNAPFLGDMPQSHDLKLFIPNIRGSIYDTELNAVKTVPLEVQFSPIDYSFSHDGQHIYVLEQNIFLAGSRIRKVNYSDMQTVAVSDFPELIPKRVRTLPNGDLVFLFLDLITQAKYSYQIINF